jgi:cob(I)alamin adenosyltransferase
MVKLNRIYTRTGDDGSTGLTTGPRRPKFDLRVAAYGTVDETNACIGLARLHAATEDAEVDAMLGRISNDLFDLGADLSTPDDGKPLAFEPLRIAQVQVDRIETEIDRLNGSLQPLRSFVLPGGTPAAVHLHLARTVSRRAERLIAELAQTPGETVALPAVRYINRLSDFLFVASRYLNARAGGDVLWVPGQNR